MMEKTYNYTDTNGNKTKLNRNERIRQAIKDEGGKVSSQPQSEQHKYYTKMAGDSKREIPKIQARLDEIKNTLSKTPNALDQVNRQLSGEKSGLNTNAKNLIKTSVRNIVSKDKTDTKDLQDSILASLDRIKKGKETAKTLDKAIKDTKDRRDALQAHQSRQAHQHHQRLSCRDPTCRYLVAQRHSRFREAGPLTRCGGA